MNTKILWIIILTAAAASMMYFTTTWEGLKTSPNEAREGGSIQLIDSAGRVVNLKQPVSRVVAIGPGSLRLLVYLNATDLIVGIEEFESRPPRGRDYGYVIHMRGLVNLSKIGIGGPDSHINYEALLSVRPDLIIMSPVVAARPEEVEKKTGAPVIVISYGNVGTIDLEELNKALTTLGRALGREKRAEEVVSYINRLTTDLSERTRGVVQEKSVYVGAVSFKGGQPFTSTQSKFPPLVLLHSGSVVDKYNITLGAGVSWEILLKEQPDVVFIDLANYPLVLQDFNKSRHLYCSLKAFKEGEVYGILPFNHYWTNIATMFVNAYFIGKILYPEKFVDIDIEKKAGEIYRMFLGVDIYPQLKKDFYGGFRKLDEFKCRE